MFVRMQLKHFTDFTEGRPHHFLGRWQPSQSNMTWGILSIMGIYGIVGILCLI